VHLRTICKGTGHLYRNIYSVAGLAAIIYFDMPTGYGSGALLLFAALLIWMKRKGSRSFENAIM
jgi:hypothetical protein